ncbi:MAG: flavin reductase family protein [Chloroflexi bacterium]|nr:flavin reductase family protein [Chloroflexota bacterium]
MKLQVGPRKCLLCPTTIVLVGAMVNGKPNYNTIAYVGIISKNMVSVALSKAHYTNIGIKENKTFSVNIPSLGMVNKTDYCGMVSGKDVDKSRVFETFYGTLKTAPMIKECPISLECMLNQIIDTGRGECFIGEIVETYVGEEYMTDDKVDYTKVDPILFVTEETKYWKLGQRFAEAWKAGEEVKQKP